MGSGGILFCIHSLPLHPSDLRHFELRNAQLVTLRGQIEATPKCHIRSDPAGSKIWFETDMEASAIDLEVTRGGLVLNSGSGAPFRW